MLDDIVSRIREQEDVHIIVFQDIVLDQIPRGKLSGASANRIPGALLPFIAVTTLPMTLALVCSSNT
jgi:hypothetical protein